MIFLICLKFSLISSVNFHRANEFKKRKRNFIREIKGTIFPGSALLHKLGPGHRVPQIKGISLLLCIALAWFLEEKPEALW